MCYRFVPLYYIHSCVFCFLLIWNSSPTMLYVFVAIAIVWRTSKQKQQQHNREEKSPVELWMKCAASLSYIRIPFFWCSGKKCPFHVKDNAQLSNKNVRNTVFFIRKTHLTQTILLFSLSFVRGKNVSTIVHRSIEQPMNMRLFDHFCGSVCVYV